MPSRKHKLSLYHMKMGWCDCLIDEYSSPLDIAFVVTVLDKLCFWSVEILLGNDRLPCYEAVIGAYYLWLMILKYEVRT